MVRYLLAMMLVALALPALAADREFDLGFARPGMLQGQFRFGAWPPGMSVYCSDDPDKPASLAKMLTLPHQMANMGATRCSLLAIDDKGNWSPAKRKIAGQPGQMSATFGPDPTGMRRLVQIFVEFPRAGFSDLGKFLVSRFGPPQDQTDTLIRWKTPKQEAILIHEDGDTATLMLFDLTLQAAMDAKMQAAAPAARK